ncbi:thiopeptide-type bacteriocin biosynthesis protein [Micromonospora pisi]|uniref:Thiopeptide-type bacteriocin biosynthesis protein n=1 Tax=Micromonospora pisi TaxID=589240 RepID=A0A495JSL3_9ACTN|nr:thiopeptide-type bacteriocin biosynthesis protein [Micromonospora pisi]RKR91990.1 thiopeptide-type bacteriocin biosynthesis protein [Micromonospora pisi]
MTGNVTMTDGATKTDSGPVPAEWLSLHCFAYWRSDHFDRFLVETVAPRLDVLREQGRIADWFYIRYAESGPHLRLRLLGADPDIVEALPDEFRTAIASAPYPVLALEARDDLEPHGTVRRIDYLPEVGRYGGPAALPVAEEVFCRSSEVAVRTVAATNQRSARLTAAVDLITATAQALELDRLLAARWLRSHAMSWRWVDEVVMPPTVAAQARVTGLLTGQSGAIAARWSTIAGLLSAPDGTPATGWPAVVRDWAATVRRARRGLAGEQVHPWLPVWASQLHMLLNRLGVTPEEERTLCWLVASATLAPDGVTPFFADTSEAPDRRYHEASKLLPGRSDQDPAAKTRPRERRRAAARSVPLPAALPPTMALGEALLRRRSALGRLTGPVAAPDLGTLLWSSYAATRTTGIVLPDGTGMDLVHRPYPSAGASSAARLRLLVFDVPGLPAGCYDVDGVTRSLWPLGRAASLAEVASTSAWLDDADADADSGGGRVGISELPALLGLYVELGALRPRYGLRGLRFAIAEAGHLAQNLALVAAATGLELSTIGGFYDDVAHELFGLDGVDDLLVYLLPLGRGGERRAGRDRPGPAGGVTDRHPTPR